MLMLIPSCTDDKVRVDSPLSLVQSVHKCLLLSFVHLHDIPPYCSAINGGRRRREHLAGVKGC